MIQVVYLHDIGWELNLGLPQCRSIWFSPWVEKIPWRRAWQPTPVFLPGKSPWTKEPGKLQFMGLERVRHDYATKHSTAQTLLTPFDRQKPKAGLET